MGGALLAALRSKGVTADEVRGFAGAMRRLARRPVLPPGPPAIDIVGTGGDASGSFNISTGAALLVAAMGVRVVKHGNRSVSSRSGSADLLECLGLPLPLDEKGAGACLAATGFTFLFAPHYHPSMKEIAPVRRALGVRTVFNLLGPLTNPAEPPFGLMGAYSDDAARLMAETLVRHADRACIRRARRTRLGRADALRPVRALRRASGPRRTHRPRPARLWIAALLPADLAGSDAAHNAAGMRAVFAGEDRGPHRDAIVLNAALALEMTGPSAIHCTAIHAAAAALDRGDGAATAASKSRPSARRCARRPSCDGPAHRHDQGSLSARTRGQGSCDRKPTCAQRSRRPRRFRN